MKVLFGKLKERKKGKNKYKKCRLLRLEKVSGIVPESLLADKFLQKFCLFRKMRDKNKWKGKIKIDTLSAVMSICTALGVVLHSIHCLTATLLFPLVLLQICGYCRFVAGRGNANVPPAWQ